MADLYPKHIFFPRATRPPSWVKEIQAVFAASRSQIDTAAGVQRVSNTVLEVLRPGLERVGFRVEAGKAKGQKLPRPVLFDEMGEAGLSYDIDAYHEGYGIVLEVEAVRAIRANALYKDLIQMSLMVDAKNAVIAVPIRYQYKSGTDSPYGTGKAVLDAIFTSGRIRLPFEGVLLVGY